MEPSWLETYYTALEFVYWEPQHLGRKKNPDAELDSLEKVSKRLRKLEVTLNHNLDQFFRLAPDSLRSQLFAHVFERRFSHRHYMHGRDVDREFELVYAMQPDFLFESSEAVVSIEMKIDAKSTVSQVLKYALLGLAVEMKRQSPRTHCLLMLGRGTFDSLWKERFSDLGKLRDAIASTDLQAFLQRQPLRFRSHLAHFTRIVRELQISWTTYGHVADFLERAIPSADDTTPGSEVYRKLILGMVDELSNRQLRAQ